MTHCLACGSPLEGRRKGTRYCDAACRKVGHLKRHRVFDGVRLWSGYPRFRRGEATMRERARGAF